MDISEATDGSSDVAVANELKRTSGVIEHGLFVALDKSIVLVGKADGVSTLEGAAVEGAADA